MGASMNVAKACVRVWTWLYTQGLPADERSARRDEIESDLWEFQCDVAGENSLVSTFHLLLRLLIGMPDDLGWRMEQASVIGTLTQRGVVLSGRAAGAALFICAVWVIDLDSSRRRQPVAVPIRTAGLDLQSEGTMTKNSPLLTAGIAATLGVSMLSQVSAQSGPVAAGGPAFEVASVRPNKSSYVGMNLESQPGGRLTGTNVTTAMLIRFAYDLPDFLIFGSPGWLGSDRFDVTAKADGDVPLDQKRLMLRRLLAERFKLTVHTEARDLPIYAMVMARNDGRMGPQLRRTTSDCASAEPAATFGIGPSPAGGPPSCGYFGFAPGTQFSAGRGGLAFRGLTMGALAKAFVPILRRSVRDSTGLAGYFDGDFDFIAEIPLPPPPPGVPNPFEAPFASVFAVLPDQLGLKLESTRAPVDVLVIDSVERPAPE